MTSICIFGSQARRSTDSFSDRDVLLVGEPPAVERLKLDWLAAGWNVTTFERGGFERMAEVKSLFIQHLKQEANIIVDAEGYLATALRTYSPKTEYLAERNDALRHVLHLPHESGRYWYDLCLADTHYVFLRNVAILNLASKGEYCFDYRLIMERLSGELKLSSTEESSLQELRSLKHGYRNRIGGLKPHLSLSGIRSVAQKAALTWGDLSESSIVNGDTRADYFRLRQRELELVGSWCPTILDRLSQHHPLFEVWQSIRGAAGYPRPRGMTH